MDISQVSGQSQAMTSTQRSAAVSTAVLKKAIDLQAQSALQLLQALPQVAGNPPHLGNNIDVKA